MTTDFKFAVPRAGRGSNLGCLCLLLAILPTAAQAGPSPTETAARVDALLAAENYGGGDVPATPAARTDDETFLRRASLDLVGTLPAPEDVIRFVLDSAANKRQAAIERFLSDGHYGQNWARYWRDVILSRRKDDRALLVAPALTNWLTDQFNKNVPWSEIAREFITASGDVRESGATAIILAQTADPADTTAEMSRILLGIQIQCAQCHNHPNDHWKREQFHELAAFFPRIGIRPEVTGERRSFSVISLDRPHMRRAPGATEEATLEHYMPDLDHPQDEGQLMKPVFFATDQQLALGLGDLARREKLSQWMTAPGNRWFARALVNRIWAELVGHGFYEPVDDMGPDRQPRAGQAFEELTSGFIDSQYDIKWLFRTIMASEAYQRESRSRRDESSAPFAASIPQRLRADQLFNVVCDALEIDEQSGDRPAAGGGAQAGGARRALGGPRAAVIRTFGYDPSLRRDEIAGSIPQALWMMNAGDLNRAINARSPATVLGRLLGESTDDKLILVELYLRCLAREPKPAEIATCLEHVQASQDRATAMEDILWALLNSTEFLNRR
jgi:hypothetical protein